MDLGYRAFDADNRYCEPRDAFTRYIAPAFADPVFDPFWSQINEARAVVGFHIGESGCNQSMSVHWGDRHVRRRS